jgi:hypothetical protein
LTHGNINYTIFWLCENQIWQNTPVLKNTLLSHHICYSCIQVWMTQHNIFSQHLAAEIGASSSINARSVQKTCDCTMCIAMVLTVESKVYHCTL